MLRQAGARQCRSTRSEDKQIAFSRQLRTSCRKLSRKVQQMHPLVSLTSFSWDRGSVAPARTGSAAMFTSDMLLTITATLRPSRLFGRVFPAPRKPTGPSRESGDRGRLGRGACLAQIGCYIVTYRRWTARLLARRSWTAAPANTSRPGSDNGHRCLQKRNIIACRRRHGVGWERLLSQ